jgi:putative spermidine/putrescine transport system permease protein
MASPRATAGLPLHWLGMLPFSLFVVLFLILPTMYIVVGAFRTAGRQFTFRTSSTCTAVDHRNAYWISIRISFCLGAAWLR